MYGSHLRVENEMACQKFDVDDNLEESFYDFFRKRKITPPENTIVKRTRNISF